MHGIFSSSGPYSKIKILAALESPFDVPPLLVYEGRSEDAFTIP